MQFDTPIYAFEVGQRTNGSLRHRWGANRPSDSLVYARGEAPLKILFNWYD